MSKDPGKLIAFTMPKWGIEMAEGTIGEWLIEEGDSVEKGQTITAIETDKISNEVDAEWNTTLLRRLGQEGDTLPVGALVAVFGPKDTSLEDIKAFVASFKAIDTAFEPDNEAGEAKPGPTAEAEPAPKSAPKPTLKLTATPEPAFKLPDDLAISPKARELAEERRVSVDGLAGSGSKGRITLQDVEQLVRPRRAVSTVGPIDMPMAEGDGLAATPLARREAQILGVDLAEVDGTGRQGRIRRGDVRAKAPAGAGNTPDIIKYTAMRRAMAKRLVEAVNTIPHFYLRTEADVDWLLSLREKLNREDGLKLSVNDFVLKAVANALIAVPDCNVHVFDTEIHRFPHVDLSVAVSIDGGLLTPVVRGADTKTIEQISAETKDLASRARDGKLMPEDYKGGTFSVSNLGMFGLTSFDAVINPPQGAILALGAARRVPRERDYALVFSSVIEMTLSCDHRAIDGALGARFLVTLKDELEHPARLIEGL